MICPSCGAELEPDSRFAHMVVCAYCESAVVLDEKAARVSGKMAVLARTPGPFFVGGTGKLMDRAFRVLGRVRYGYTKGYWDEWYLAFDDGSTAWVGEDGADFTLETGGEEEDVPVAFDAASPGDDITIGETTYRIGEKETAACEGGEGQLPFAILSGEKVPFLDLAGAESVATVEYDTAGQSCRIFRGRPLDLDEVSMDMTAEEAGADTGALAAERAAGESQRERIVKGGGGDRSLDIKCFSCGAPLQIPSAGAASMECQYCGSTLDLTLRRVTCAGCGAAIPLKGGADAKSVVCSFCSAQLDVSAEKPSVLGSLKDARRPKVPFTLGQTCRFEGVVFEVTGHLRYKEGIYRWDEFMLHNPDAGYRWLDVEDGHFDYGRKVTDCPGLRDFRNGMTWRGRRWWNYEGGKAQIEFVDGELPWVAAIGDEIRYADKAGPPYMLSYETTETEFEAFLMEYVQPEDVAKAFGMKPAQLPRRKGVAGNQPYPAGPFRRQSKWVFVAAAAVCAILAASAFFSGRKIQTYTVQPAQYNKRFVGEKPFMTEPFTVTAKNTVCKATLHAPVRNSWIYLGAAVVNEDDKAILDFSSTISYYSGSDWSEGSTSDAVVFKIAEPGKYRLLLLGEAGSGWGATQRSNTAGKPVTITMYQGVTVARYYIIAAVLLLIPAVIEFARYASFVKKRKEA